MHRVGKDGGLLMHFIWIRVPLNRAKLSFAVKKFILSLIMREEEALIFTLN